MGRTCARPVDHPLHPGQKVLYLFAYLKNYY